MGYSEQFQAERGSVCPTYLKMKSECFIILQQCMQPQEE
jgi:hypothetical protein